MKTYALILLFSILSIFLYGQERVVQLVCDPWPPYANPEGKDKGFSIEVIQYALQSEGYEIQMHFVPWARAVYGLENGLYDMVATMWKTDDRAEKFIFSDSYYTNILQFVKRKGDPFRYEGMPSLDGKVIGLVRGYAYDDIFLGYDRYIKFESVSFLSNVRLLLAGRIDLTIAETNAGRSMLEQESPASLPLIEFAGDPLSVNRLYVSARRGDFRSAALIEAFNAGLETIRKNGIYRGLLDKYDLPYPEL